MSSPAERIIKKFGGVSELARLSGWTPNMIYKWTYSKEKGGTGGLIPIDKMSDVLRLARANEVGVEPEDFFDLPEAAE